MCRFSKDCKSCITRIDKQLINTLLEDDFDERCDGQCSVFESDDILMPRIEYFLYNDVDESQAEFVYKKLLKLNLFSQEKIADNDEPCVSEGADSFLCSEACVNSYEAGILHLESNLQKALGKCRFWGRKFEPIFQDIKDTLNMSTPGTSWSLTSICPNYFKLKILTWGHQSGIPYP